MHCLYKRFLIIVIAPFLLLLGACAQKAPENEHDYECDSATVTTLAGSGAPGSTDDFGSAASFDYPYGITIDSTGTNLYVADKHNHKIRRIDIASGAVTTLAGSGTAGSADDIGSAASFSSPLVITINSTDTNLYVVDSGTATIRKIDIASSAVTTLTNLSEILFPEKSIIGVIDTITIDNTNTNLYISRQHSIYKVNISSGEVTHLAGSDKTSGPTNELYGSNDGIGVAARFQSITGGTIIGSSLYVTDYNSFRVRKIDTTTGEVTTLAGHNNYGWHDDTGTAAAFSGPNGITNDGTNLYITDESRKSDSLLNAIRKIEISTGKVTTLAGSTTPGSTDGTGSAARFKVPAGIIATPASGIGIDLYVADARNDKIRKIHYAGCYSVGGTVSGKSDANKLLLQNNAADDKTITADGAFTFDAQVIKGNPYDVTVLTQPDGQNCAVIGGSGTSTTDVNDVGVTCTNDGADYTVGGTVSGLNGTLVLQNKDTDDETITVDGTYTFATPIASAGLYAVAVFSQPAGQTCAVSNGSGASTSNVTNVNVTCTNNTYNVGGTVTGLTGTLVLQNYGADDESITVNDAYTFATPIAHTGAYDVTVSGQPAGQTCVVSSGSGTISAANVTNVNVTCTTDSVTYLIGGTVFGLNSVGLVLQNNLGDDLDVFPGFPGDPVIFEFMTPALGYSVTVLTDPATETCSVTFGGSGTASSIVTDIEVTCSP